MIKPPNTKGVSVSHTVGGLGRTHSQLDDSSYIPTDLFKHWQNPNKYAAKSITRRSNKGIKRAQQQHTEWETN